MKIKTLLLLMITGLFVAVATAKLISIAAPATIDRVPVHDKLVDEAPSDIQVVLIALQPEGFEPGEIKLSAGEYLFVVRNRSGLDEVDVRLARENGELLGQAKVRTRRNDWKQRLKLTPGTYVLSAVSHPAWSCRVVVED